MHMGNYFWLTYVIKSLYLVFICYRIGFGYHSFTFGVQVLLQNLLGTLPDHVS
jgi:hypothetical protein